LQANQSQEHDNAYNGSVCRSLLVLVVVCRTSPMNSMNKCFRIQIVDDVDDETVASHFAAHPSSIRTTNLTLAHLRDSKILKPTKLRKLESFFGFAHRCRHTQTHTQQATTIESFN